MNDPKNVALVRDLKVDQEKCIGMIRELLCLPSSLENYARLECLLSSSLLEPGFTKEYYARFKSIYLSVPNPSMIEAFGYHASGIQNEKEKRKGYNLDFKEMDFLFKCQKTQSSFLQVGKILRFIRGLTDYCLWRNPTGTYKYLGAISTVGEKGVHIFEVIVNYEDLGAKVK